MTISHRIKEKMYNREFVIIYNYFNTFLDSFIIITRQILTTQKHNKKFKLHSTTEIHEIK